MATRHGERSDTDHAVFLSGNDPLVAALREALARDDTLRAPAPPDDHVVVFDEAQRAWNTREFASFMKRKKGLPGFTQTEPDVLFSPGDRHTDWAVVFTSPHLTDSELFLEDLATFLAEMLTDETDLAKQVSYSLQEISMPLGAEFSVDLNLIV